MRRGVPDWRIVLDQIAAGFVSDRAKRRVARPGKHGVGDQSLNGAVHQRRQAAHDAFPQLRAIARGRVERGVISEQNYRKHRASPRRTQGDWPRVPNLRKRFGRPMLS